VAEDLAAQKGEAIYRKCLAREDFAKTFFPLIVSSDTLVALDHKIYNKPSTHQEAAAMLDELKGRTHTVHTGVSLMLYDPSLMKIRKHVFSVSTKVTFKKMSDDIRDLYVATGDSLDKAGAYGIQGMGLTFVESLEGSYSNVVGFPLVEFIEELKAFLGAYEDSKGQWRDLFLQTAGNESR
jgi:septum formation protein